MPKQKLDDIRGERNFEIVHCPLKGQADIKSSLTGRVTSASWMIGHHANSLYFSAGFFDKILSRLISPAFTVLGKNKTKGTLVHERERLTLLVVCFDY